MNNSLKTILILVSLFILIALFWGIIGKSFFKYEPIDKKHIEFKKATAIIVLEDVNAAIEFYRDIFGFELILTIPEKGEYDFAHIKRDNAELMLHKMDALPIGYKENWENKYGASLLLYFEIENLYDFYESVKDRCEILLDIYKTDYGTKEFIVRDINGYTLIFSENLKN